MRLGIISAHDRLMFAALLEFHLQQQPRKAALYIEGAPRLARPAEQARTLYGYR